MGSYKWNLLHIQKLPYTEIWQEYLIMVLSWIRFKCLFMFITLLFILWVGHSFAYPIWIVKNALQVVIDYKCSWFPGYYIPNVAHYHFTCFWCHFLHVFIPLTTRSWDVNWLQRTLRKQLNFHNISTGFLAKCCLRKKCRNSILMTCPTQIWVVLLIGHAM